MGFLLGGSCSPCCGGGEGYAVKLENLPHENIVGANTTCSYFDGESYLDSKNGTYRVTRSSPDREDRNVFYLYRDYDANTSDGSGKGVCGPPVLEINLLLSYDGHGSPGYLRITLRANGGTIQWQKNVSSFALPITLSPADVIHNQAIVGQWDLSAATATLVGDSPQALPPCVGDGNFLDLSRIQHVAAATVRPGYCVGDETEFTVLPNGVTDTNHSLTYYNAGSDELSVNLSDYVERNSTYGSEMKVHCSGAHTLGWGGRFNIKRGPLDSKIGSIAEHGWVSAFPCRMTYFTASDSGEYEGVCVIRASLKKKYGSNVYSGRRLAFGMIFLGYYGPPYGRLVSYLNKTYVSDGAPGEDGYVYGSMPSFAKGNVEKELTGAKDFTIVWPGPTSTDFDFTLSQN